MHEWKLDIAWTNYTRGDGNCPKCGCSMDSHNTGYQDRIDGSGFRRLFQAVCQICPGRPTCLPPAIVEIDDPHFTRRTSFADFLEFDDADDADAPQSLVLEGQVTMF